MTTLNQIKREVDNLLSATQVSKVSRTFALDCHYRLWRAWGKSEEYTPPSEEEITAFEDFLNNPRPLIDEVYAECERKKQNGKHKTKFKNTRPTRKQ